MASSAIPDQDHKLATQHAIISSLTTRNIPNGSPEYIAAYTSFRSHGISPQTDEQTVPGNAKLTSLLDLPSDKNGLSVGPAKKYADRKKFKDGHVTKWNCKYAKRMKTGSHESFAETTVMDRRPHSNAWATTLQRPQPSKPDPRPDVYYDQTPQLEEVLGPYIDSCVNEWEGYRATVHTLRYLASRPGKDGAWGQKRLQEAMDVDGDVTAMGVNLVQQMISLDCHRDALRKECLEGKTQLWAIRMVKVSVEDMDAAERAVFLETPARQAMMEVAGDRIKLGVSCWEQTEPTKLGRKGKASASPLRSSATDFDTAEPTAPALAQSGSEETAVVVGAQSESRSSRKRNAAHLDAAEPTMPPTSSNGDGGIAASSEDSGGAHLHGAVYGLRCCTELAGHIGLPASLGWLRNLFEKDRDLGIAASVWSRRTELAGYMTV
ncbi:hypothetical protein LTR56_003290 [Elasticomyces elasticus]|nr:hypothetical protein LTR56_003290 [Elasticomyces elasticus]KAK3664293.1 hypothetical protein LTR22_004991 [Elasticomyces elasticus]KAK4898784.1 hypothetical protein LTR49_027749 [Elasticomyces elasticus]KAK5734385.1 hypothetical protein LTS12_026718 [Elasticomyces elasticus]